MLPSNPLEFIAAFLPGEDRVLTRTGVEIHRLQYWSDGLSQWVGQRIAVRTHYDPRDITYVYIRTPAGMLIKATVTTPNISAISLIEWSMRRQHERAMARDPDLIAQADESLRRNDETIKQAKASRAVRRRKATAASGDRFRDTSAPTSPETLEELKTLKLPAEGPCLFAIEEYAHDF